MHLHLIKDLMSMALILGDAKLLKQNIVYGSGQHKSVTTK